MSLKHIESFVNPAAVHYSARSGNPLLEDGPQGKALGVSSGTFSIRTKSLVSPASNDWTVCFGFRQRSGTRYDIGTSSDDSISVYDASGQRQLTLRLYEGELPFSYRFVVEKDWKTSPLGTTSRSFHSSKWQYFAWSFTAAPGTGGSATLRAWDGSAWETVWTFTSQDFAATGSAGVAQAGIYLTASGSRFDNWTVWTGTIQPSSPVLTFHRQPLGDEGTNQWQAEPDGSHYENVDGADGALVARSAGLDELFTMSGPSRLLSGSTIAGLSIRTQARRTSAAAQGYKPLLDNALTEQEGTRVVPSGTVLEGFEELWEADPFTAGAWDVDDLANIAVGARSADS